MCETMANIPVEEKSSYVLTEDMIDAAMNEQFAFQVRTFQSFGGIFVNYFI